MLVSRSLILPGSSGIDLNEGPLGEKLADVSNLVKLKLEI